jgi:hypothetical protein
LQTGIGGAQVHRATHQFGCFRVLALLMAQHAEQMKRVDVGGLCGKRGLIVAFRFGEAAIAMRREATRKNCIH